MHGIGEDMPAAYWQDVAAGLIEGGQLALTTDGYSTTRLTEDSMPVLRGDAQVQISQRHARRARRTADTDQAYDRDLYQQLRALRKQLADEQAVPPYVVFTDASLRHMARDTPTNETAFAQISGVGEHKLRQYATVFTEAIENYLSQRTSADNTA